MGSAPLWALVEKDTCRELQREECQARSAFGQESYDRQQWAMEVDMQVPGV